MRIGMLADMYKPHISGVTNYIALNKRFLEEAGHEVFVFTFGDDEYRDDERNVIRTRGLPIVDTGAFFSLRYSLQAQRTLRTMDVVHFHHPFTSGRLAIRYCQPRGIPIVFTNHTRYDLYAQAYLPILPDVLGEAFFQAYFPSLCRSCDLVIAPSPGIRDVLLRFGVRSPIEVVPNGVDLSPFRTVRQAIRRADLGFRADDVVLVYTGRLGPEKNLSFLLRAFTGTAKTYSHVGLLLVGDGPDRDNLEDQVKYMGIIERVRFVGMVPYEDVPRYLAMADAFVTASVTEVHPLSVIEAMAAGLPVLGIKSPGISDSVEDGLTGLIAEENELALFTAKMVRLVIDHEGRSKMGQQARQTAEAYNIERTSEIMKTLYQRLVSNSVGRKNGFRTRLTTVIDRILK